MDDMTHKINVLITGAGAPAGPGIIKSLSQDENIAIFTCDTNEHASGRYLTEHFFVCPKATDEHYIEFMLEACSHYEIDVLLPVVTLELFHLSKYKAQFEKQGTRVIVSDYDALEVANNKALLHHSLHQGGYRCADFEIINTFDQLEDGIDYFLTKYGRVCIKPSVSNGSRGVRIIDQSVDSYDLLFNQKPNSLYTTKDNFLNTVRGKKNPQLLLSEVLPGEEYTVDSLIENGNPLLIVPRVRTKMNGGISVAGQILENEEIIDNVKQICNLLKLHGPIGFQFKKDSCGVFKLLEINPRIQGSSVTLMGAGVNLPLLAIKQATGNLFSIPTINWGVNFIRFYDEVYY
jgi:carbamoyl-phosphate synthase large subunit